MWKASVSWLGLAGCDSRVDGCENERAGHYCVAVVDVVVRRGDENHSTFELSLTAIYHHNKYRNSLPRSRGTLGVCSTRKEDEQHWGTSGTMAGKRYLQRGRHCGWLGHLWPLWAAVVAMCRLFRDVRWYGALPGQTDRQTVGGLGDLLGIALRWVVCRSSSVAGNDTKLNIQVAPVGTYTFHLSTVLALTINIQSTWKEIHTIEKERRKQEGVRSRITISISGLWIPFRR